MESNPICLLKETYRFRSLLMESNPICLLKENRYPICFRSLWTSDMENRNPICFRPSWTSDMENRFEESEGYPPREKFLDLSNKAKTSLMSALDRKRRGKLQGFLQDLETASLSEPQNGYLKSMFSKAKNWYDKCLELDMEQKEESLEIDKSLMAYMYKSEKELDLDKRIYMLASMVPKDTCPKPCRCEDTLQCAVNSSIIEIYEALLQQRSELLQKRSELVQRRFELLQRHSHLLL